MRKEIESNPEDISSIARRNKTEPEKLRRAYRNNLSEFREFHKTHREFFKKEAFVFPENIGPNMGIDETTLRDGEFYTILCNKDRKGKKGSLAAIIKGTKASRVVGSIDQHASVTQKFSIKEMSLDLSSGMDWIVREIAPNAIKTYDRFHVERLITEAVQQVRIKYRWEAISKENKIKKEKELQRLKTYRNGDTEKQLLARSRLLLYKRPSQWSPQQRERAKILFEEFPLIKKAYYLYIEFKEGYSLNRLQAEHHFNDWIKKVKRSQIDQLITAAETIRKRLGGILNYLENKSTNASVENFNRKLKELLSRVRGINNKEIFFYRLIQLYA